MAVAAAAASCPPIMHPSIVRSPGFATVTVGVAPEQANGLALCRGDTNASTCAACVAAAFREAKQTCPFDKGTNILRDACNLQFAGRQFLDFLRPDQWIVQELIERRFLQICELFASPGIDTAVASVNALDAWFCTAVTGIFTAMINSAVAATNSTRKYFTTAEMAFNPKIYGLCRGCLGYIQSEIMARHMDGRPQSNVGALVWCLLRYSVLSPVYEARVMLQLAAPPEPPSAATPSPATPESGAAPKKIGNPQCTVFDLISLQEATEHFSEKNKLGEGGFGTVYKKLSVDKEIFVGDLKKGEVTKGLYQGKPDATISFSDNDFLVIASGKTNPQIAFIRGAIKIKGSISAAQKFTPDILYYLVTVG
ncbi:hypothetical protein SETIT_7G029000v2 [Setaria italica]|uniref:Gnk2-homologous domain-containing protein n=1 Tax=Setaria italica TaxID=4555 RepID=A0A368RR95_SETIT|nr:hypothetical protein SETIT_7G029000v2 [Setaria italica]